MIFVREKILCCCFFYQKISQKESLSLWVSQVSHDDRCVLPWESTWWTAHFFFYVFKNQEEKCLARRERFDSVLEMEQRTFLLFARLHLFLHQQSYGSDLHVISPSSLLCSFSVAWRSPTEPEKKAIWYLSFSFLVGDYAKNS